MDEQAVRVRVYIQLLEYSLTLVNILVGSTHWLQKSFSPRQIFFIQRQQIVYVTIWNTLHTAMLVSHTKRLSTMDGVWKGNMLVKLVGQFLGFLLNTPTLHICWGKRRNSAGWTTSPTRESRHNRPSEIHNWHTRHDNYAYPTFFIDPDFWGFRGFHKEPVVSTVSGLISGLLTVLTVSRVIRWRSLRIDWRGLRGLIVETRRNV